MNVQGRSAAIGTMASQQASGRWSAFITTALCEKSKRQSPPHHVTAAPSALSMLLLRAHAIPQCTTHLVSQPPTHPVAHLLQHALKLAAQPPRHVDLQWAAAAHTSTRARAIGAFCALCMYSLPGRQHRLGERWSLSLSGTEPVRRKDSCTAATHRTDCLQSCSSRARTERPLVTSITGTSHRIIRSTHLPV